MAPRIHRFGKVLPVRLSPEVDGRLRQIAHAAGITKSDALRLAIHHGLPSLQAGRLPANLQKTSATQSQIPQ